MQDFIALILDKTEEAKSLHPKERQITLQSIDLIGELENQKASGRRPIPAAIKHAVWIRDQGRCPYINPDGGRCEVRMMLEIDHREMVCRGGENEAENLSLRCRYHNAHQAKLLLGYDYRDFSGKVAKDHAGL
jgi:5-methylcytosine-specific restriction endonuclease McrA